MIVLIDKPKEWTSFDVVAKVRGILKEKKVGHAGTLDPNATGLLIIGTGVDTKKLGEITKNTKKTYEAEIVLGASSNTDDVDGEITKSKSTLVVSEQQIKDVVQSFEGEQVQIPPQFSAIKMKGKKAYELARKGEEVRFEPRKVIIYKLDLVSYDYPLLKINCEVSSGTYIRSLARDIGEKLGVGAYLKNLRRTKIGEFQVSEAWPITSVEKAINLQELQKMHK